MFTWHIKQSFLHQFFLPIIISISINNFILVAWAKHLVVPSSSFLLGSLVLRWSSWRQERALWGPHTPALLSLSQTGHMEGFSEEGDCWWMSGSILGMSLGSQRIQMVHLLFNRYQTVASEWDIYPHGIVPSTVKPSGFLSKCHYTPSRTIYNSPLNRYHSQGLPHWTFSTYKIMWRILKIVN